MINIRSFLFFLIILVFSGCGDDQSRKNIDVATTSVKCRSVVIQPIGGFPDKQAKMLMKRLKEINPNVCIADPIPMYDKAYYEPLHRYRADSLLLYLRRKTYRRQDAVILGLIQKDISTTIHDYSDYGVMGLARTLGDVCIVSTRRLSRNYKYRFEQLFKVTVHELAHTEGLRHCELSSSCYMKDSKYRNPGIDQTEFCVTCKTYLQKRGWNL